MTPRPADTSPLATPWAFDMGLPDPATFPRRRLGALAQKVLAGGDDGALLYGGPGRTGIVLGYEGLRDLVAQRASQRDDRLLDHDHVMLTAGAAHAVELLYRTLLRPGDAFAVESPTWGAALRLGRNRGAEPIGIPMDHEGMRIDRLREAIGRHARQGRQLGLVYTIATFNTPTGWSMSPTRRRELVELAVEHGFTIVEDGVYSELRYDGEPLPTLASLEPSVVAQVGSFSKTIAPGLRLGWLTARPELVARVAALREDLGSSQWVARIVAGFVGAGDYDAHLAMINGLYRRKRDVAVGALRARCGDWVEVDRPDGGMFLWVRLSDDVDGKALVRLAAERGVTVRPGEQFVGNEDGGQDGGNMERAARWFRMAFTMVPEPDLERGIEILRWAIDTGLVHQR